MYVLAIIHHLIIYIIPPKSAKKMALLDDNTLKFPNSTHLRELYTDVQYFSLNSPGT